MRLSESAVLGMHAQTCESAIPWRTNTVRCRKEELELSAAARAD